MTTLVLRAAGTMVGSFLGGPVGGMIGGAIGAVAGYAVDSALFGAKTKAPMPKHAMLDQLTSNEGASIPRLYGRARIGGELIWATRFEEQLTVTKQKKKGAKGGGGGSQKVKTYQYFANVAIGLCEGPVAGIRRIWADSKELDLTTLHYRFYPGDETQGPDPLIAAKEYPHPVPAYRGLAYLVFERLPITDFGNRLPQILIEVIRPLNDVNHQTRGICLIPGAGEFAYDTIAIARQGAPGVTTSENRHVQTHTTDFLASLDNLRAVCPNVRSVSFVVAWFGDDLRAGQCSVAPRVDSATKSTKPEPWVCAGLTRETARLVSFDQGKPIYGGTPSDASIIRAIREMRGRGLAVLLNPFVMMDIVAGNALPNPHTGQQGQPPLPWRGRITGSIAPGRGGSVDGTATADTEIAQFFGRVRASEFISVGDDLLCTAPDWRYRQFILHYAHLAKRAGGVDAFLIGSEFIGLTRLRGAAGHFPAVLAFAALARDVRAILGAGTKIGYGADWTEYGAYWPRAGELRFPLDPLWASPDIDFIGIDCYWPITDWRGPDDADAQEARSPYDPDYLTRRNADGEGYAWYYPDEAARAAGRRVRIQDGLGKDWVNRPKDIRNWWLNPHIERRDGVETTQTAWVPQSKPFWFTEIGCPAVDCGGNSPNLFPDPRSSENGRPPFSRGLRDDLMMMRMLEGAFAFWDNGNNNPVSSIYGDRMVDTGRIHVWAWDARPYPAFPSMASVWGDAANYMTGHWINGRFECVALDRFAQHLFAMAGLGLPRPALDGLIDGFLMHGLHAPRDALDGLCDLAGYDLVASSGQLRFVAGHEEPVAHLTADDLVPDNDGKLLAIRRAQDSDLPREVKLTFADTDNLYRSASVSSRRIEGQTQRKSLSETGLILSRGAAQRFADHWLERRWTMRETAEARLRPGLVALEVGDVIMIDVGYGARLWQITRINDQIERSVELRSVRRAIDVIAGAPAVLQASVPPLIPSAPALIVFSPPIALADPAPLLVAAAYAKPWSGGYDIRRGRTQDADEESVATIEAPATIGTLNASLAPGPLWRFDRTNTIDVTLSGGTLVSVSEASALAASTLAAIGSQATGWEIIAYASAELLGERRYRLTGLLRGLGGSEAMARRALPAGAQFIALDGAVTPLTSDTQDMGALTHWRAGADETLIDVMAAPQADALRPLAPVHPRIQRQEDGLAIAFIRRTRINGDGWEGADVPLGEDVERYRVSILDDAGIVLNHIETERPSCLYQNEISDFGMPQTRLRVRIVQLSRVAGDGAACDAICLIH